jgi:FkbM family methyltransferase
LSAVAIAPRLRTLRASLRAERARFFGLDNLDERLLQHVPRRRGTFVELGAFDGLNQSNTAWLEANRGWRGVLIEAIPEAYEQCVRNRPLANVANCACVSDDYPDSTVEMVYSGLMSIVRGARSSDEDDHAWVSLGEELQQLERYTCTVLARTLTAVLDEHRLGHVDLLSLDVEGYEIEVLRGFDLDRFRPAQIVVEDSRDGEVGRYLTSRGYRKAADIAHARFTSDVLYERVGLSTRTDLLRQLVARWMYFARSFFRRLFARTRRVISSQTPGEGGLPGSASMRGTSVAAQAHEEGDSEARGL